MSSTSSEFPPPVAHNDQRSEPVPSEAVGDTNQVLVGISFADMFRAQEFLLATSRVSAGGTQRLRDAVFVVKDADGKTVVDETGDLSTVPSALTGSLWAGLVGLILGGPVGWAAGAAIGAGVGAVTAKVVDLGVPDEWVAWFREAVLPSTTTLVLLLENFDQRAMNDELGRFPGAALVHTTLGANAIERWQNSLSGA